MGELNVNPHTLEFNQLVLFEGESYTAFEPLDAIEVGQEV